MTEYCKRCQLTFEMARDPGRAWAIVLPPHDPRCSVIAHLKPLPLSPLPPPRVEPVWRGKRFASVQNWDDEFIP